MTFPLLLFYGLGTILGAGIYVLTGVVASHAAQFTTLTSAVTLIIFMAISLSLIVITATERWHTKIIPGFGFLLCLALFLGAFSG
ncbi:MAG: hypothetical protein O3C68_09255 [Proteobacteria bacterium]|nr:hypothetical protein [Pseudomonadota bacterium]